MRSAVTSAIHPRAGLRRCGGALIVALAVAACSAPRAPAEIPAQTRATLALLETTDLHDNLLGYDYARSSPDPSVGLERVSTLIARARAEFANTLLLDNGDTIQGTMLSDLQARVKPLGCGETLAVYKVMNHLRYDGGTVGNHEFNYGLPYLEQVTGSRFDVAGMPRREKPCAGPNFPLVLANVISTQTQAPLFSPYRILRRTLRATAPDGREVSVPIRIGLIGFTPPTIMQWDRRWLQGKVRAEGVVEAARRYVPQMRAEGADVVVALSHGGFDARPYTPEMENANLHLARVPGIDAILAGHSHQSFPDALSPAPVLNAPGVDKVRGVIHGVPTVMASHWGKQMGVIALLLRHDGQRWSVVQNDPAFRVELRSTRQADNTHVPPDPAVARLVAAEHAATLAHAQQPIGQADWPLTSYFADVGDPSAMQVVNDAQARYVADYVQSNLPQHAGEPVLSVAAPFKTGFGGANDFTDVPAGPLTQRSMADLYLYPNTLAAVRVSGDGLRRWLEHAARRFNRIDPKQTAPQQLVSGFPGFHFDMLTTPDLTYEIDVTQPVGSRIQNLRFRGAPLDPAQTVIVATNNYRASGGGGFPGLGEEGQVLIDAPDTNREALARYIAARRSLTQARDGSTRSWRFARVHTAGPVWFKSAPGKLPLAHAAGLLGVTRVNDDDGRGKGLADYAIDLSR